MALFIIIALGEFFTLRNLNKEKPENEVLHYYAMIFNDDKGWKHGQAYEKYSFEWALVKCDEHGNYLAVKEIDTGPALRLKIPENHEYFKLLLTVSDGNSVSSTITTLHTPLVHSENSIN